MSDVTVAAITTTKKALEAWKEKSQQDLHLATNVKLDHQTPPIIRMGAAIKRLVKCEVLSLSCNMIEKPAMLASLGNLRVLNLSLNNLKTLHGVECLGKTLEELWVSYNRISSLKPVESMKALKVFYASHNNVKDWIEFKRLASLPKLMEITFFGNPIQETMTEERFRREAINRMPNLVKLDFVPIIRKTV